MKLQNYLSMGPLKTAIFEIGILKRLVRKAPSSWTVDNMTFAIGNIILVADSTSKRYFTIQVRFEQKIVAF